MKHSHLLKILSLLCATTIFLGCQQMKEAAPPGTFLYNLNEWNKEKAAGKSFSERTANHANRVKQNSNGRPPQYWVTPGGGVVGVGGPSSVVGSTKVGATSDNPNFTPNSNLNQSKGAPGTQANSGTEAKWSRVVSINKWGSQWQDEFGNVYEKTGNGFRDRFGNIYNPLGGTRYSR